MFSEWLPAASAQLSIAFLALGKQLTQSLSQFWMLWCVSLGASQWHILQVWSQHCPILAVELHVIRMLKRKEHFPSQLLLLGDWVTKPELTQRRRNIPSQFPGNPAAKGSKHQALPQGGSPRPDASVPVPSLQRLVSMVPALAFRVASDTVSGCPSRQKSTAGVLQAHMASSPPLAGLEEDRALPGAPLCRLM